jgi:hypothetical protein
MAERGFPELRQVVLDCTDARALAEFYRRLLGLRYRPGGEPPAPGEPDTMGQDWLVLQDAGGSAQVAFQQVAALPKATWPDGPVLWVPESPSWGPSTTSTDASPKANPLAKRSAASSATSLASSTRSSSSPDQTQPRSPQPLDIHRGIRPKRSNQRTASTITSAGKRKPAKAERGTGAGRGRRVLIPTVSLLRCVHGECNSPPPV